MPGLPPILLLINTQAESQHPVRASPYCHFADLNRGVDVGVVEDIPHICAGVRAEGSVTCLYRIKIEMKHDEIDCSCPKLYTAQSLFYRKVFARTLSGRPRGIGLPTD